MPRIWLRSLAIVLLAALLVVWFPSISVAGGCDDPGYTGGACSKASTTPWSPPRDDKGHGKDRPDLLRGSQIRSWLMMTVLLRIIR